jgi:hypothetical protein
VNLGKQVIEKETADTNNQDKFSHDEDIFYDPNKE